MNESLWLDEATTALVSKMSINDILVKFLPGDFHPPLYYFLMKFWANIFGNSEVALRIPSLIFVLLTVYVVYKFFGKISALFLATAPLLFYYAQEARMYTMAMFLVTCLVIYFVKITKKGSVGDWIIFSFLLPLVFLTDYVAVLIIPALWIGAGIERKNFSWWKKFIASHIILLISGVAWLPYFLKQLASGLSVSALSPVWSQILGQTSFKNLALIPVKFMIGRIGFDNKLLYALMVGSVALLFGYLAYRGRKVSMIVWLWLIVPLIFGIILSFRVPFLSYFRFLFVLPAFYILIAKGSEKLAKFAWVPVILILGINLTSVFYYVITPRFHREDWKRLVSYVEENKSTNSVTLFVADSNMEAYRYYAPNAKIAGPEALSPEYDQIWLMRYVQAVFDPEDGLRQKIEALKYQKSGEFDFNGIVVWEYTK